MAPRASKQAERNSKKAAKKVEDDEPAVAVQGAGALVERVKELVMGSCLVQLAPKLPEIVKELKDLSKGLPSDNFEEKKEEDKKEKGDEKEDENHVNGQDESETKENADCATSTFQELKKRFAWHNILGLASPPSADESVKAWLAMKDLELDFGPRGKRRGTPGMDRILANLHAHMPQYIHLLLALMVLRALLFRSWFACLP